jgi:hypothetical protein
MWAGGCVGVSLEQGFQPVVRRQNVARDNYFACGNILNEKKRRLTLYLVKAKYNAKAVLETYQLFIYGYIHYITNSFCKIIREE